MTDPTAGELVLRYSHHVIEHLGLKLYQNRPTNVVAELVSNGWDAGASHVWIDVANASDTAGQAFIAVADNGSGMTRSDIADNYLVIGKPKDRSGVKKGSRYPMGRKGIGKLAPFGIARTVEVLTAAQTAQGIRFNWLRIDLARILELGDNSNPSELTQYPPVLLAKNATKAEIEGLADETSAVSTFLKRIGKGSGTLVLMRDLSILRQISVDALKQSMGRRFTVTLNRPDFSVLINNAPIKESDALPEFEFRIPEIGTTSEMVGGDEVKYWVGFVKTAAWPADESGVGVYAHGKIAQDRPFTFGIKGREIHTRYMYGVVEADFLDQLGDDVISTDRTSIAWDHPRAAALHEWGQRKVRQWIADYRLDRQKTEAGAVSDHIDAQIASGILPKIGKDERDLIAGLLAEVTPGLAKDQGSYASVTAAVMKAYLNRPTRELLKKLWSDYAKESIDGRPFLEMVDRLAAASVPESLSVAVVFAQRAYALSVLADMQHRGTEPDLQKLIEKFPWILQPEMEMLTANQQLATVVKAAFAQGLTPSRTRPDMLDINDQYKPDFVFFSDIDRDRIVVVEIKTPREDLNIRNREQLAAYMTYIEQQYPKAQRKGYLVGANGAGLDPSRRDIEILTWSEVFNKSRRGHVDMLAAMLSTANPDADDDRMAQILEFGGEEVWELLNHVAANDEKLAELVSNRPKLGG